MSRLGTLSRFTLLRKSRMACTFAVFPSTTAPSYCDRWRFRSASEAPFVDLNAMVDTSDNTCQIRSYLWSVSRYFRRIYSHIYWKWRKPVCCTQYARPIYAVRSMLALKTMNAVHKRRGTYPQLYILKYILSKLSTINFQLNHKEVISKGIIVF